MTDSHEQHIRRSWQANAEAWTGAVRNREIESRRLVTDQAIVNAVTALQPASVLDAGCGEGWLARELAKKDIDVHGIDATEALVERARARGLATFSACTYEELAEGRLDGRVFDAVVSNFALLGDSSTVHFVNATPSLLGPGRHLIIQTLHPVAAVPAAEYRDAWRTGSWDGFGAEFTDPAPWYFRTLSSWLQLFRAAGLALTGCIEPRHPESGGVVSIIFVCRKGTDDDAF